MQIYLAARQIQRNLYDQLYIDIMIIYYMLETFKKLNYVLYT